MRVGRTVDEGRGGDMKDNWGVLRRVQQLTRYVWCRVGYIDKNCVGERFSCMGFTVF